MKRKLLIGLVLCLLTSVFTVPASAAALSLPESEPVTTVEINKVQADAFYQAALQETFDQLGDSRQGAVVKNGGTTAYSNGLVKQTLVIENTQQKSGGSITANVIDRWYRAIDTSNPMCRVSFFCTFDFDGNTAKPDRDSYSFHVYIYSAFEDSVEVEERSVTFSNGTYFIPAQVDVDYQVYFGGFVDNETMSIECDKDGNLTTYGDDEYI